MTRHLRMCTTLATAMTANARRRRLGGRCSPSHHWTGGRRSTNAAARTIMRCRDITIGLILSIASTIIVTAALFLQYNSEGSVRHAAEDAGPGGFPIPLGLVLPLSCLDGPHDGILGLILERIGFQISQRQAALLSQAVIDQRWLLQSTQ